KRKRHRSESKQGRACRRWLVRSARRLRPPPTTSAKRFSSLFASEERAHDLWPIIDFMPRRFHYGMDCSERDRRIWYEARGAENEAGVSLCVVPGAERSALAPCAQCLVSVRREAATVPVRPILFKNSIGESPESASEKFDLSERPRIDDRHSVGLRRPPENSWTHVA